MSNTNKKNTTSCWVLIRITSWDLMNNYTSSKRVLFEGNNGSKEDETSAFLRGVENIDQCLEREARHHANLVLNGNLVFPQRII